MIVLHGRAAAAKQAGAEDDERKAHRQLSMCNLFSLQLFVRLVRASSMFLLVGLATAGVYISMLRWRESQAQQLAARMQAELNSLLSHDLGLGHVFPSVEALGGHVPIFIIHRDRHTMLLRLVESILAVIDARLTPFAIFVHDMQSSNPETLRALSELEAKSLRQPREPPVLVHRDVGVDAALADAIAANPDLVADARVNVVLNRVRQSIDEYLKNHRGVQYYVVTDPDVELAGDMPGDILALLALLLDRFPGTTLAAPGLRIDDLPQSTCRSHLVRLHESPFWAGLAHSIGVDSVRRYFSWPKPVDTTFAMYRRSFSFHRLSLGLRLHHPYVIRHMPWYEPLARSNWTAEMRYYMDHALPITHWTNKLRSSQDADAATLDKIFELELMEKFNVVCDRKLPPY